MIGMVALTGSIMRNSILPVDLVDQRAAEGLAFKEAVILADATRAKSIVLTGAAAMMGRSSTLNDPIF